MYYIEIDVHTRKCVAAIKQKIRDKPVIITFENTQSGISDFIRKVKADYMPAKAVCESTANYWIVLHDMLEDEGIDTLLANPYKLKIIIRSKRKNDKKDAGKLADILIRDSVPESYVPDREHRDMRALVRTRLGIVHNITKLKNIIHATAAKYPHTIPRGKMFTQNGLARLDKIQMRPVDRMGVDSHLSTIEHLKTLVNRYEQKIAEIAIDDGRAQRLITMTGLGLVTVITILAEIGDHTRFGTPEQLTSYAGLTPSHRDSGEVVRHGHITKRGSVWLRNAMTEAALPAIRFDPKIRAKYEKLANRIGTMKARMAIAREMLETIWYILQNDEDYRTQNKDLVQRKRRKIKRIRAYQVNHCNSRR